MARYKPRYVALRRGEARPSDMRDALVKLGIEEGDYFLIAKDEPLTVAELDFTKGGNAYVKSQDDTLRAKALAARREMGEDIHEPENYPGGKLAAQEPDEDRLGGFAAGSDTSRKAAIDNYPRSGTQRWHLLRMVGAAREGKTRDELVVDTQWPPNVVTPRIKELVEGGWLHANGRVRQTRAGSDAEVLMVTELAYNKIAEEAAREG